MPLLRPIFAVLILITCAFPLACSESGSDGESEVATARPSNPILGDWMIDVAALGEDSKISPEALEKVAFRFTENAMIAGPPSGPEQPIRYELGEGYVFVRGMDGKGLQINVIDDDHIVFPEIPMMSPRVVLVRKE
ncbi:MAG: hypothetical protein R3F16_05875 [Myxococcota bacterium]|nr:hypothetical protein [Myxococcales bacterium]